MNTLLKIPLFISLALSVSACRPGNGTETTFLTKETLKNKTIPLGNPTEIPLNIDIATCDAGAFYLLKDSLILAQNSPSNASLIDLYSLKNKNRTAQLILKGRGPDELLRCSSIILSAAPDIFYISDGESLYTVNTDSTLSHKKIRPVSSFRYAHEDLHPYMNVCPLDSCCYVGYNMWYIDDPVYNNNQIPRLSRFSHDPGRNISKGKNEAFPGPVNGASLFTSPDRQQIWLADWHKDIITICDTSLHTLKQIIGPDNLNPEYTTFDNPALKMVVFPEDRTYRAYSGFACTPEHVYLIYEGVADVKAMDFEKNPLPPVKIFQFTWDGNLVCSYQLDRYITTLSVSSDEKSFYCTAKDTMYGEAKLLVYNVPSHP